jgi:hypothetical protein
MSEIQELSSTFELESIAQEELKKRAREKAARSQAASLQKMQVPAEPAPVVQETAEPEIEPKVSAPAPKKSAAKKPKAHSVVAHGDKRSREIARKHEVERKALQKNLNEMAKKRDRDIRDLMEKVLKDHYAQVDKERADYVAVLNELKKSVESQSQDVISGTQQVVTSAAQEEVERMVNWFHDEFMKELTSKSQQYEELKISSEKQVNKMSQESDNKSQRIMMLDEKIKELSIKLPKDVREELFKELGLEHLEEPEKPGKEQKKKGPSFFAKLSQMFKNSNKSKAKPAQVKPKPTKGLHKKPSPQNVIAQ